jgi:16S rRNA (guanine527-N7)-methyltransferase
MGISLTRDQMDQMACHAAQLETWNRKINLTAITDPRDIARKHFLDAIAILPYMDQGKNHHKKIVDMGSGGGFPGLPIKLLHPDMQMVLVDASRKKVNFLKHVIRMLGIGGIDAFHCRVEALHQDPDFAGRFDAVLARGFAGLESLARLAAPLVTPAGTIYALKGPGAQAEITPDLESRFDIQCDWYTLPFKGGERCLVRLSSIKKVPESQGSRNFL